MAEQHDRQKAMHIGEPGVGNALGDVYAKELASSGAIETIDAVDDLRFRIREAFD
jgi:hypothetical protein